MLELFLVGTFWFWALCALELVLLFVFVAHENGWGATLSVLGFAALLQFFGDANIMGYIAHNPWHVVAAVALYFLIGTVWGVFKWWLYVSDRKQFYEEAKSDWLRRKGVTNTRVVPDELKAEWKKHVQSEYHYDSNNSLRSLAEVPIVKDNKARILRWMGFWWVSMTWTLINDFVTRIFRSIYYRISKTLQAMADRLYAGIRSDLE